MRNIITMLKAGYLVAVLFLSTYLFGQDSVYMQKVMLGKTCIQVQTSCYLQDTSSISFINLHDNENTSVEAADPFLAEYGGCIMQLKHGGDRNISFVLNKKKYTFDPNRIFTPVGIQHTMATLSRYDKKAAAVIADLANNIVEKNVLGKKLIVALHNNSESNYSILSYTAGQSEAQNASRVYINPNMDADDFIYTTEAAIFDTLQARMINVVLQNNETLVDDGSLSVYASRLQIPYINVEAQEGHLHEQRAMLLALIEIFDWYKN